MIRTTALVAISCVVVAAGLPGPASAAPRLVPGFDIEEARLTLGSQSAFQTCPEPVAPVVDMSGFVTRYDPKDPTQSRVVPEREAIGKARDSAFYEFAKGLDALSDMSVRSKPADPALNACIIHQLAVWARADAATQKVDENDALGRHQAILVQSLYGSAFATVVGKIGGFEAVPGDDSEVVKVWFRRLAQSVMADYSGMSGWAKTNNNRTYWAGFAVAMLGVDLDDQDFFDFGRTILSRGLQEVAADGSLTSEMRRGERAFGYQQFALLPLASLVVLYDRNGAPLNAEEEVALERLVEFNATRYQHLDLVEPLASAEQLSAGAPYEFAWIDILASYLSRRNPPLVDKLEAIASGPNMRPGWHVFLGGNVTATYNPRAVKTSSPD
jgi:poly(beta-D-mannuronate) lyase